jgi:D-alanyl-D-alanine dipeptidase
MNTREYCKMIERNTYDNEVRMVEIQRKDNKSPLVSLKDSKFNLMFETFINNNYSYLVRKELIEKIGRISKKLNDENKQLIILSAWRNEILQKKKWHIEFDYIENKFRNRSFEEIIETVSKFFKLHGKSNYSSGGSVCALIYDLREKKVLDFGNNIGTKIDLGEKCYPYYPEIPIKAQENRKLLINLFLNEGFVCSINKFWHFHFGNVNWALAKGLKNSIYDTVYA